MGKLKPGKPESSVRAKYIPIPRPPTAAADPGGQAARGAHPPLHRDPAGQGSLPAHGGADPLRPGRLLKGRLREDVHLAGGETQLLSGEQGSMCVLPVLLYAVPVLDC